MIVTATVLAFFQMLHITMHVALVICCPRSRQTPSYSRRPFLSALRLRGLRFDSETEDEFSHIPTTSRDLSRLLTDIGVPHVFEEYNGDHRNRLWGRTGRINTEVLPWFSLLLEADRRWVRAARP